MELIHHAVYHIKNKAHGGYLSFENGYHIDNKSNYAVQTDVVTDSIDHFKQLWICIRNKDKDSNGEWRWKLRCVQNGGYLMRGATDARFGPDGSSYVKAGRQDDSSPQNDANDTRLEWTLDHKGNGNEFIIQHAGSKELLDAVSYTNDGNIYVGSSKDAGRDNQLWQFDRRSRGNADIDKLFKERENFNSDIDHYGTDPAFLTLPQSIRQDIWAKSLLGKQYFWTPEIFDCDDFSVVMKAEVSKWQYNNLRSDNISCLMGIVHGRTADGGHAFNFYLSQDLENIKLYEPQSGEEKPSLDKYQCYFALY